MEKILNIEPRVLDTHCSIGTSWKYPLYDPYQNSVNPCFLSFVNGSFNLIFIIPLIYKSYQLYYNNHHGPFPIKYSFGSVFKLQSVGIYNLMKFNSIFIQCILSLILLSFNYKSLLETKSLSLILQTLILIFFVLPLHLIEPTRNIIASAPLLLYWSFNSIINLIIVIQDSFSPYKIYIPKADLPVQTMVHVVEIFLLINSICIFSLQTFLYSSSQELIEYYELNEWDISSVRNVFQRFLFFYMRNTLETAKRTNRVESADLPSIPVELDNENAYKLFLKYWNESVESAKQQTENLKRRAKNKDIEPIKPSLFVPMLKVVKFHFLRCFISDILEFIAQICQPFLLRSFLIFATERVSNSFNDDNDKKQTPIIVGFALATCIFLISVIRFISFNRYIFNSSSLGSTVNTTLSSHIYSKSMKLSPKERKNKTVGEIVNNMAQDVQILYNAPEIIILIVSQPIRLIFYMVTLYNFLGVSAIAGLATALILIPIASACFTFVYKQSNILMKHRDERAKLMSEILNSIKSIKLYSWETPMMKRLSDVRNGKELKVLKKVGVLNTLINSIWDTIPFAIAISSFICTTIIGKVVLTPAVVFPALTLFELLSEPILALPNIFSDIAESKVSIERLIDLFVMEELEVEGLERTFVPMKKGDEAVVIKNATFLWTKEHTNSPKATINTSTTPGEEENLIESARPEEEINTVALTDINFTAKKGELACIVGRVGAGKTTLLKAILGSIFIDSKPDTVLKVNGSVAYCAQSAWILNASVRENILFGRKYDKSFYEATVEACELSKDFEVLPDGDRTVVGEKGISLSGGQKARLSLARAVYSKADIYILDDILSAVDTHVGKNIIKNVLGKSGLLASKTTILATNSVPVLHEADNICLLVDGRIVERGTFDEVISTESELAKLVKEFGKQSESSHLEDMHKEEEDEEVRKNQNQKRVELEQARSISGTSSDDEEPRIFSPENTEDLTLTKVDTQATAAPSFVSFGHSYENDFDDDPDLVKKTGETDEIQKRGNVDLTIYFKYIQACGYGYVGLYLLLSTGGIFVTIATSFILKHWSEENAKRGINVDIAFYLLSYAGVGIMGVVLSLFASLVVWTLVVINGSTYFHDTMASSVFKSPMSFFETTPIGRILNRFTDDMQIIDSQIIWTVTNFITFFFKAIGVFAIVVYNLPIMFIVLVLLLFFYDSFRRKFIPASREIKRLLSANRSPVLSHLQESVTGVETISAYNQIDRFSHKCSRNLDTLVKTSQSNLGINRWLSMRLQALSSIIVYCCTLLILGSFLTGNPLSPGLIGFIMTYVLDVTGTLNAIVRTYAEIETRSVTIERLVEYCNLKPEADMIIEDNRPDGDWPKAGGIEFKKYEAKYRENLEPVLRNIEVSIKGGEKIGIVGRTGAGKSTLTLALFRIIEASNGHIEIDGLDTSKIGLYDLRSKLNIIPQDSQAFEGTVRENLDPFGKYDDTQLWKVLELSHLKEHIENMRTEKKSDDEEDASKKGSKPEVASGLDAKIDEGGANLSSGQKQLMCLARALLNPSKVLILDEATASVDVQTDKIVQDTIRSEFNDKTILTIAHRIETIMDSDRILVLERGEVKEFDSPQALLKDTNTIFYSLCKEGGHI